MKLSSASNSPLSNKLVNCTLTTNFDESNLPVKVFGALGSQVFTLEQSNSLVSQIELDHERTTSFTNEDGIANFGMKIIRGIDETEVSVLCESDHF